MSKATVTIPCHFYLPCYISIRLKTPLFIADNKNGTELNWLTGEELRSKKDYQFESICAILLGMAYPFRTAGRSLIDLITFLYPLFFLRCSLVGGFKDLYKIQNYIFFHGPNKRVYCFRALPYSKQVARFTKFE
jgi:hypothetical protein